MIRPQRFGMLLACVVCLAPLATAQDLTRYRDFQFGMSVNSVAKQTLSELSSTRTVHAVPDLIQTLNWDRQGYFSSSATTDPVRKIRFDFRNDQLYKIVVTYGSRQIEGMTADDLIEAISKTYGSSIRSDETVVISPYTAYEDRQKVLARWETAENSYSLFQSPLGGEFGLVGFSKKLELMAAGSILEAQKLETAAAPQRAIDRQQKEAESRRAAEEKARSVNKPNFRP